MFNPVWVHGVLCWYSQLIQCLYLNLFLSLLAFLQNKKTKGNVAYFSVSKAKTYV